MADSFWLKCIGCKTQIDYKQQYYRCSVSTCNRKRNRMVFCSVACWEAHLPLMRHREAYAIEDTAPSEAQWNNEIAEMTRADRAKAKDSSSSGNRRVVSPSGQASAPAPAGAVSAPADTSLLSDDVPKDVLIVASKLKKYIKARSGMNTSDSVMRVLSNAVRELCDKAILEAHKAERKTVMDRDF